MQLKLTTFTIALAVTLLTHGASHYAFTDTTRTRTERVADLLGRLTIDEKISFLQHNEPGVSRLGVPKYYFGNEALHGVVRPGKFTVFPQAIGLGAMWDIGLLERVATAISDEARGRWTQLGWGSKQWDGSSDLLSFFSPTINMARDPRWGRTPETYGEDPFLTGRNAVAFVNGMQGHDSRYVKCIATLKHFVANNIELNRGGRSSAVSERSLREYYFPAYEMAVRQAHVQSVMSAYNALNGVPCSLNRWLLTDVLRGEWGFDGYVVSDCSALTYATSMHHFTNSAEQAASQAIKAGLDLECGADVYGSPLKNAYTSGMVSEAQIDTACGRILMARMRLGLFDPTDANHYNRIQPSVVGSTEHQKLAAQAARESIVLLKNKGSLLPIDTAKIHSIALVGNNAARYEFGDYSGTPVNQPVSILQGLLNRPEIQVNYAPWVSSSSTYQILSSSGTQGRIKVEYFSDTNLQQLSSTDSVDYVYYDPTNQPPNPHIPGDQFSMRWTATIQVPVTGRYMFAFTSDDGCRLYVDDRLIIDKWEVRASTTNYASIGLKKGETHTIRAEYFQNGGEAIAQLRWHTPSMSGTEPIDAYGDAGKAIRQSDMTVAVMGIDRNTEREGQDRDSIEMPADQLRFLQEAYKINPRLVVVFVAGSPLAIEWLKQHVPAIVYAWYPGEQGGTAVADVLMGDYNPAGRLPFTFYPSTNSLPDFDNYDETQGRTYMYCTSQPTYAFGHGLSYTTFAYSDLALYEGNDSITVKFNVTNTGNRQGDEVPQVYVRYPLRTDRPMPAKQLRGFTRVGIPAHGTVPVSISIAKSQLRLWDTDGHKFVVPGGTYEIMVGAASDDIRLQQSIAMQGTDGVQAPTTGNDIAVSAVKDFIIINSPQPARAAIYGPDGRLQLQGSIAAGRKSIAASAGLHIVRIITAAGIKACKVIVK